MPVPTRRTVGRSLLQVVRRLHLFLGLFLLPWLILYGVTAFLFNHPTAFSEQPTTSFGPSAIVGTPAERMPTADQLADQVIERLNEFHKPQVPFTLAGAAKFNREFAFATVKQDSQTIGLLLDVRNGCGTVRVTPNVEPPPLETPPFAVGTKSLPMRSSPATPPSNSPKLSPIELPPHDRFHAAIPTILERNGYQSHGTIVVTSVPEVVIPLIADNRTWFATYNPMTGTVSGTSNETKPELGWRRFVLRLHSAHGYPGAVNARWLWALIVDVMAFVLCFWGVSGVVMWWQIRSLRRVGIAILIASSFVATSLAILMYRALQVS